MLQDFYEGKIIISIELEEKHLLDDLDELLEERTFASGSKVNCSWFKNTVARLDKVYIVCYHDKLYYGSGFDFTRHPISITDIVNSYSKNIDIKDDDYESIFM